MTKYIIAILVVGLTLFLYQKGKKDRKRKPVEYVEKGTFEFKDIKYLNKNATIKSRNVNSAGSEEEPLFEIEIVFSDRSSYKEIINPSIKKKHEGKTQHSINGYDITVVEANAIRSHNHKMNLDRKTKCTLNDRLDLLERVVRKS